MEIDKARNSEDGGRVNEISGSSNSTNHLNQKRRCSVESSSDSLPDSMAKQPRKTVEGNFIFRE